MKLKKRIFSMAVTLSVVFGIAQAEVRMGSPFSDHMVLQQGASVPVWGFADPGEKVTVSFCKQKETIITGKDGKWMIHFTGLKTGGPFQMLVKGKNAITLTDIYVGEVWFCSGQSNMDFTVAKEDRYWCGAINEDQEVASANYPLIREYKAEFSPKDKPQPTVNGKWEVCSPKTVGHFSAVAYFFARNLYQKLNVPIGLVVSTYGASTAEAWTSRPALKNNPKLTFLLDDFQKKLNSYLSDTAKQRKYLEARQKWEIAANKAKTEGKPAPKEPKNPDPVKDQHSPCVLYNGMIAPLVPYAIRGALWYQGESNSPTANVYGNIMETLINDWRKAWGQGDFPFYYVQLANIQLPETEPAKGGSEAIKREAQLQNLSIPNTGMVVAIDNADKNNPKNVHPKNKQEIGYRLSLIARALVYHENITYSGPIYDHFVVEGKSIRLFFKHVDGGLVAKGDTLKGFAISGANKKFVWGIARIEGNSVVVSSPDVDTPVAVRYGWGNNPPTSLYNKADLPASPFRTDN